MGRTGGFSAEARQRAVRLVFDQKGEHGSQWVIQSEKDKGLRDDQTTTEREQFQQL